MAGTSQLRCRFESLQPPDSEIPDNYFLAFPGQSRHPISRRQSVSFRSFNGAVVMFSALFYRIRSQARSVSRRRMDPRKRYGAQIGLEILEDRTLLSTVTWISSASGDWDTAANWRDDMGNNRLPGAADDVVLPSGSYTVTHGSAVTDAAASITNQATLVLSGGTLNVSGNVTGTGMFTLSGGTLGNATVTVGTTITGTTAGGTLNNVTLNGYLDLTRVNVATATISTALQLDGTIGVGDPQGPDGGELNLAARVTVSGTGDILFGLRLNNTVAGSSAILGPHVKIHGDQGQIRAPADHSLILQGTIICDVPTGRIMISDLTNDNGTLSTSGPNTGVTITGTLINTNSTLTISGVVGVGGTLEGGTVTCTGAGILGGGTVSGVTLRDATLAGGLLIANGLTVVGTVRVNCPVQCTTTETIGGTGSLIFAGGTHNFEVVDGITVTLGPSVTIGGQNVNFVPWTHRTAHLINEGTIGPDAGGQFNIQIDMTNRNGTFSAGPGATLEVDSSIIDNSGSTLTLSGTGTISLKLDLQSGPQPATIRGGTVAAANGAKLTGTWGVLDGVTLNADLDVVTSDYAHVSIVNRVTLNGTIFIGDSVGTVNSGNLAFDSNATIDGTGEILFGNRTENRIGGYPATLDAGVRIHGANGTINAAIVNYGTIAADVARGTINLDQLSNFGTVEALDGGTLSCANTTNFSGGTLTGGVWKVFDNSILNVSLGGVLTTDAATIVLDGPNAHWPINRLTTITSSGSCTIQNGSAWNANQISGDLINQGTITIGTGSRFSVTSYINTGTLAVLSGGTLLLRQRGRMSGTVHLNGTLNVPAGVALEMAGTADGMGDLDISGSLMVDPGATFLFGGSYTQSGDLTVLDGGLLDLTGTFANFAGNTLTGGSYDILGTFQFTGANINSNAAQITLDGADAQVLDENGNDAFAHLAMNQSGASFTLQNASAEFSTGAFANAGLSPSVRGAPSPRRAPTCRLPASLS
jgi:hypothetical protein